MAGVRCDDVAVAFGCNPQTMRQHDIAVEEQENGDRVRYAASLRFRRA